MPEAYSATVLKSEVTMDYAEFSEHSETIFST
jgi:hypothetical protein